MYATGPAVAATLAGQRTTAQRRYFPGGEWLYARLYCSRYRQDDLLNSHIPALVAGLPSSVDRWFFVGYRDPESHLRLRFHGPASVLHSQVLPALHDVTAKLCKAGLVSRLVLDTYEPEIDRYGGPSAVDAAEKAFAADSAAALAQLALRRRMLQVDPLVLAAANSVDLVRAFYGDDWREWWLSSRRPGDADYTAMRSVQREAIRLIDPCDRWSELMKRPGGAELIGIWQCRRPAVAAYGSTVRQLADTGELIGAPDLIMHSLLHAHHKRLVGAQSYSEASVLAIARSVVEAHHAPGNSGEDHRC
jgi:thiopeptide-type bacteriocin biosynthesis protein